MSRIGKKPIQISDNVTVDIKDGLVKIKGPKGELTQDFADKLKITVKDKEIIVERKDDSQQQRALHGTVRSLIANMVIGVTEGFKRSLELIGVGFRVAKKGKDLEFFIGFSHPVIFNIPEGVECELEKNTIHLQSTDKQLIGETAANIRKLKKPEPYKGKGIRYVGEIVRKKAGKAGKAGGSA